MNNKIHLTSSQVPELAEWPKHGKPGIVLKLKMISFTKVTSSPNVFADGEFEVVETTEYDA